jgi:hypothetical protein
MEIDFSRFHDLMHKPFTATCRAQYGGWRRHLALWWTFKAWPWVREQTTCRLGLHSWCAGRTREQGPMWICQYCFGEREP